MKIRILIISILLVVDVQAFAADAGKMETRSFDVLYSLSEVLREYEHPDHKETSDEDPFMDVADMDDPGSKRGYKTFFTELGVKWPEGSKFAYLASIGKVEIFNTQENIERFRDVLILANLIPCMIEIQVDFVLFDLKDIDKFVRENKISRDALQALWKAGKGKLLSSVARLSQRADRSVLSKVLRNIFIQLSLMSNPGLH